MEMRREIGGRELQMRYTFNSLCAMEERAGGGLAQWNNRQYTPVRLLFWGALIDRQPEITLTEAGNLIGGAHCIRRNAGADCPIVSGGAGGGGLLPGRG